MNKRVNRKDKTISGLLLAIFVLLGLTYAQQNHIQNLYKYETIKNIEHIQNVDEMQPTPIELYIHTRNSKYMFDGTKTELISTNK